MTKTLCILSIPFLIMLGWVSLLQSEKINGTLVELAIKGYDPRDILAGQYLAIRTRYEPQVTCPYEEKKYNYYRRENAYLCLDNYQAAVGRVPDGCRVFIEGYCRGGKDNFYFYDKIERFYIPEKQARDLEKAIRYAKNEPKLLVSVTRRGKVYPIELTLNGKPWREWLEQQQK